MWGGLKGAVPILLGRFAVLEGVNGADGIYEIVFVVVAFSVVVQGTSIPFAAARLGVTMRRVEPLGLRGYVVAKARVAPGTARRIRRLPLGDRTWISPGSAATGRAGARGDTVLARGRRGAARSTDVERLRGVRRLLEVAVA